MKGCRNVLNCLGWTYSICSVHGLKSEKAKERYYVINASRLYNKNRCIIVQLLLTNEYYIIE